MMILVLLSTFALDKFSREHYYKSIISTSQTLKSTACPLQDMSNHAWPHQCVPLSFHRVVINCFPIISGQYIPNIKYLQRNPDLNLQYCYFIVSYIGSNPSVFPDLTKHSSMYLIIGVWLHAVGFQRTVIHNWGQQCTAAGVQKRAFWSGPRLWPSYIS